MKRFLVLTVCVLLSACGVETATTAATVGAAKAKELEQGQKTMEQVQQKVDASMQQMQQSPQRAAD